ncbi:unnamed protein product [Cyprideis torosa]|uniref:adenylate cyclase n=1 Tax=Cyprideis torosa TaxID=163714 RepID=A0A7R8W4W0_9CRUS|nr:unnamed protein product [Cyprideis torosa]CAG0884522.1 unnamed protein product [Cyprideis torosa]
MPLSRLLGSPRKERSGSRSSKSSDGTNAGAALPLSSYLLNVASSRQRCHRSITGGSILKGNISSSSGWWNPRFQTQVLEDLYSANSHNEVRVRFQYGLIYMFSVTLIWCIYFMIHGGKHRFSLSVVTTFIAFMIFMTLVVTMTKLYQRWRKLYSVILCLLLEIATLLLLTAFSPGEELLEFSTVGAFAVCIEVILLIYAILPLQVYMCLTMAVPYSIIFEVLNPQFSSDTSHYIIVGRALLHVVVHVLGLQLLIMSELRSRETFMKVGHSLLVRQELEVERKFKETIIHSVMPPQVADWLMTDMKQGDSSDTEDSALLPSDPSFPAGSPRNSNPQDTLRTLFRPFNMDSLDNVSILFADIVGFTRMSSNKSAQQLVGLLNDLFGRFDALCHETKCEKIATLGDCYYCVSGCPEPRDDHAVCCAEMGLAMIRAIQEFDVDNREEVNMRVGIHTGKVMFGIVGTTRFKFDVFSNDVTFANKMESSGQPGKVHVSRATKKFLEDKFTFDEGQTVDGVDTFFIRGRLDPSGGGEAGLEPPTLSAVPSADLLPPYPPSPPPTGAVSARDPPHTLSPPSLPQHSILHTPELSATWPRKGTAGHEHTKRRVTLTTIEASRDDLDTEINVSAFDLITGRVDILKMADHEDPDEHFSPPPEEDGLASLGHGPSSGLKDASSMSTLNSRKDSGLTRSARSSLQAQVATESGMSPDELLAHRTSGGYFTASQVSSTCDLTQRNGGFRISKDAASIPCNSTCPHSAETEIGGSHSSSEPAAKLLLAHEALKSPPCPPNTLAIDKKVDISAMTSPHSSVGRLSMQAEEILRHQSHLEMSKCIRDNYSHFHYLLHPRMSQLTLCFDDNKIEEVYRTGSGSVRTHSFYETLRLEGYIEVWVSWLVASLVSVASFLFFPFPPSPLWLAVFVVFSVWHFLISCVLIIIVWRPMPKVIELITEWRSRHLLGATLIIFPVVATLSNFNCSRVFVEYQATARALMYLALVSLANFCNFVQLNCWMKAVLASLTALVYCLLVVLRVCPCSYEAGKVAFNGTLLLDDRSLPGPAVEHAFHVEFVLDVVFLLLLCVLLSREFEIGFRLSFHGHYLAAKEKAKVEVLKKQADWLLNNIIPQHVVETLKTSTSQLSRVATRKSTTAHYSENHPDVGVIFASIVNFTEMYDESYQGGKEYLRVLNELVGDFDELLRKPEFKNVEKIKTIGWTYMAAAGLNSSLRNANPDPCHHLRELMEYALALQSVVAEFNKDLLEFGFVLQIGYNFGDVTSGVIGSTKLYYDIWGDAVNIASRMYSTGVAERIQVTEKCVEALSAWYEFEPRGKVFVKGKDNMSVFLLKGRRPGAPPLYQVASSYS